MSGLRCKKCQSSQYVKSGHTRGLQRYKCKERERQFTPTPVRGKSPSIKSLTVVLYAFCSVSMGNITRLFNVSTVAVLKWMRQGAVAIKPTAPEQTEIGMLDAFWLFANEKKPLLDVASH